MTPWMRTALSAPTLSAESEARLARLASRGDPSARAELIESGRRLAVLHALRLGFRGQQLDDAVQDGLVGLIAAVDRFDPSRGVRLSTFAWPWIAGAIRRGAATPGEQVLDAPAESPPADSGLLDGLPVELAVVLRMRFGYDGEPLARREVAERLGLTESRVRTLERRGLALVRAGRAEPFSHPAA